MIWDSAKKSPPYGGSGAAGGRPRNLKGWKAIIPYAVPALFVPNAKTAERFFAFFTANISNKNTRRAYYKAACRFAEWCEVKGLRELAQVRALHVAAYVETLGGELATPSVKQRLAAIRMLFDWLVIGHVLRGQPRPCGPGPEARRKIGPHARARPRRGARAACGHRRRLLNRPSRSRAHRRDDLHLRPPRRHPANERRRLFHTGGAAGFASTKKAARNTRLPATTSWKSTSMSTSRPPALPAMRTGRYLEPRGRRRENSTA